MLWRLPQAGFVSTESDSTNDCQKDRPRFTNASRFTQSERCRAHKDGAIAFHVPRRFTFGIALKLPPENTEKTLAVIERAEEVACSSSQPTVVGLT